MLRGLITTLVAAIWLAAPAAAEPPPSPKPATTTQPTYPRQAQERELEGDVLLHVTIDAGRPTDVVVVQETTPGVGFGESAAAVVRQWTWATEVTGTFRVGLRYRLQEGGADAADGEGASAGMSDGPRGPLPHAPKAVRGGGLRYPHAALIRELAGVVYLIVTIANDGSVSDVEVEYERPVGYEFGVNARKAVRKWRYPANVPGVYRKIIHFGTCEEDDCPEPPPHGTSAKIYPAPEPATRVEPDYPERARAKGISGVADLVIEITDEGNVGEVTIADETPSGYGFGFAAVHAVKEWTFPAGTKPDRYTLRVTFTPP